MDRGAAQPGLTNTKRIARKTGATFAGFPAVSAFSRELRRWQMINPFPISPF
jgi:hypothetical protein